MEYENDADDAALPAGSSQGDGTGGNEFDGTGKSEFDGTVRNEFDEAVTSAITVVSGMMVVRDSADRTDGDPSNDSDGSQDDSIQEPSADDEALDPGFLLGDRFEIVSLVHSGGMGHVYKAIDNRRHAGGSDQIHVAIKMMRRSVAPQLDTRLALEREAAKTQRLSHPNIVNIHDFDQHDEQFFLVMEWLDGESVNALLRRTSGQPLAPQFAWRVIEGIVSGLQHAHSNNVVHADINPSNIFITDTQEIKLLDFGVARNSDDPVETDNGGIVWATRTYASPDVLRGATPSFEDDVFSLGCVAYRLLSGTHPFAGLSSIEAEQAHTVVQPIAGLDEGRWQILSRALCYAKSDRPNSVTAFTADVPAAGSSRFTDWLGRLPPAHWLPVPVIAIALLAGFWWLTQIGVPTVPSPAETPLLDDPVPVDAEATFESFDVDGLLQSAAQAIDEERFVLPADNNARDLYREVLNDDATNSVALTGLRTISDVYVRQANIALREGAPARTIAALVIARETDATNPAIAVVNELLVAQGDSAVAQARLAAAEGDADRADEWLSVAERYAHVDTNAISDIRSQIAQNAQEQQFLERLAAAESQITAGNLIAPDHNNAQALLVELRQDHESDSRLLKTTQRLGERLLMRATVASSAEQYEEATQLLDAADALGVLSTDVAAARASLLESVEENMDEQIAAAEAAPPDTPIQSPLQASAQPATESSPDESSSGLAIRTSALTGNESAVNIPAADPVRDPNPDASATAEATGATQTLPVRTITLADLSIEKYVAPRYPRNAQRRGMSGSVDVTFTVNTDGSTGIVGMDHSGSSETFAASAERAVKKWRFAPRDEAITTWVKLRFEQPPP